MKNRIIYGGLLMAGMLACLFLSPVTRVLFFSVASCICAYEYSHQMEKLEMFCSLAVMIGYLAVHTVLVLLHAGIAAYCVAFILAVYAALLSGILRKKVRGNGALDTVAGLTYPCLLFSVIMVIVSGDLWLETLSIACLSTWCCDTGAMLGGTRYGKRKLAPDISPHKTVEGALIGAATSVLTGILVYLLGALFAGTRWPGGLYRPVPFLLCVATALISSTMGQIGDLAESLIKRMIGVKDFSNLIPGHGGLFDRADSLLFSIPTAYFCLRLFGM